MTAKINITSVPYKGGAPALNDLMGGHIPITLNNLPESIGQIQAGTVRPLAVTTIKRSPFLPNVPTVAEFGLQRIRHRGVVGRGRPRRPAARHPGEALARPAPTR